MAMKFAIKPFGFFVLFGLVGCAKVAVQPSPPVAPVAVVAPEIAVEEPEIVKSAAEIEAESYNLGDHWWAEKRTISDNKSTVNRDLWINKLLPNREVRSQAVEVTPKNAVELAKNLRSSSGHESYYWVNKIYGNQSSSNMVVIVPQYHRATGLPVLWSSLGEEVASVQSNLKYLVEDLVQTQGLQCLGIEGSSASQVRRSVGLDRAVNWAQRLHDLFQRILYEAAVEDARLVPAAQTILEGLKPYFARYVQWQDGVGAAVASLGQKSEALHRFGLEDQQLIAQAEQLHGQLRALKEKVMVSQKADRGEQAIRDMWLTEFPDFRDGFLFPMEESFGELRRASITLRRDGATDEARLVADFLGQVRVLMDQVISAKEVERYHTYYRDESGKRVGKGKTKAKRNKDKQLKRRIAKLEKKYQRIVMNSRERVAAKKVIEFLNKPDTNSCGLVMGAGHEEGLVKALLKQSNDLGIVVVRPYNH